MYGTTLTVSPPERAASKGTVTKILPNWEGSGVWNVFTSLFLQFQEKKGKVILRGDRHLISQRELKETSAVLQTRLFIFCAVTLIAPTGLTSLPCKQLALIKHSLLDKSI
jgi:hypothetical protein